VLSLGSACGGKSARQLGEGQAGAHAAGTGARGGANASGGMPASSAGGTSNSDSGDGGAGREVGGGGLGGRGGGSGGASISGGAGAGGATTGGGIGAGDDGGASGAAGDGGASGGPAGDAGAGGIVECGDCSLSSGACVVGVCDVERGRCTRLPVVACQSGDGCCPAGCAQDDDADCTSFRVVLEPAYSGNRSEDGTLGAPTFTGVQDGQRFHAFFGFNLSGIQGTIQSAELYLYNEGYFSSDPDEHFVVRTVSEPFEALLDTGERPDVFDALQSGAYCFDTSMTPEHVGSLVTFGLNETTLADLNANLGAYATFGIVADWIVGDSSSVEGIRFSDGVTPPLERLSLIVEP